MLRAVSQAVVDAVGAACRAIYQQARADSDQAGMGTTCTMVLMAGRQKAVMAHVGDSRLYLLRGGEVLQLSEDHTYVGELVKRGALSEAQAINHPQGNVLSRAMGVQEQIPIDGLVFDVDPGDTLMLCSDGIYNYYPDPRELIGILGEPDLERATHLLLSRAMERGGHDNLTTIIWRPDFSEATAARAPGGVPAGRRSALLGAALPFIHLSPAERLTVLGLTQICHAAAGHTLSKDGVRDSAWMLVLEGAVDVFAPQAAPSQLGPGQAFGLARLLGHATVDLTARSATPCHYLALERDDLMALINAQPLLGSKIFCGMAEALRAQPRAPAAGAAVTAVAEATGPLSF